MAWEIWQQEVDWVSKKEDKCFVYRIGFFCNTTDVGFGPVTHFSVNRDYDDAMDEIYGNFSGEPRNMTNREILDELDRIMEYSTSEWEKVNESIRVGVQ